MIIAPHSAFSWQSDDGLDASTAWVAVGTHSCHVIVSMVTNKELHQEAEGNPMDVKVGWEYQLPIPPSYKINCVRWKKDIRSCLSGVLRC